MRKSIILLVMSLLMVFSLSKLFKPQITIDSNATVTLLYETDDFDLVKSFDEEKSLFLVKYDGKIAEFIYQGQKIDEYINQGFVYNSTYQTMGNPFIKPIVNDTYYTNQYAIPLTQVDDAWQITSGSSDVTVAIIDTGIDTDHPEFTGRLSPLSYNAANDLVGLSYVEDDQGHGTMVAGVIGANKNNSIGIAGVTSNVILMVIKANDDNVETFKDSDIIRGIYYAVDNGADIINLSLGSTYANPLTLNAINYAKDHNVLVVASSGNDGAETKIYPASFEPVISVGSIDSTSTISDFSNYNASLDIVAPGDAIYTTDLQAGYTIASGTSFSAPYVAGIAALYKSVYPNATQPQMKLALESTAKDLGTVGVDKFYGYGLVDALALVSIDYLNITVDYPLEIESSVYYIQSGQSITIETPPIIENYEFVGFFLDQDHQIPYDSSMTFTQNTIIYAYYRQTHAVITWTVDGNILITERYLLSDLAQTPETTQVGFIFHGWFLDAEYTLPVTDFTVTKDQTYYGYYELITYELQFYQEDHNTLVSIITYSVLDNVTYIEGPIKPSDTYYNYTFIRWSDIVLYQEEISTVYPIYQKTLKDEFVTLNYNLDTIYEDTIYTDTGITVSLEGLTYTTQGVINTRKPGIQTLTYRVYEGETLVYILTRNVHILKDDRLVVTLNKAITTLYVGQTYVEKGVDTNYGDVVISGDVDTLTPGIYKVTYTVTYENQTVVKSRYVIVLEAITDTPVAYVRKKETLYEI